MVLRGVVASVGPVALATVGAHVHVIHMHANMVRGLPGNKDLNLGHTGFGMSTWTASSPKCCARWSANALTPKTSVAWCPAATM